MIHPFWIQMGLSSMARFHRQFILQLPMMDYVQFLKDARLNRKTLALSVLITVALSSLISPMTALSRSSAIMHSKKGMVTTKHLSVIFHRVTRSPKRERDMKEALGKSICR